jgi:DMSO/TMAO reductase YedYZ heme-binding membrane subunit
MTEWIWLRAAGIGAYVALFLSVAWGLVSTTGVVTKRVSKASSNRFHASIATAGLALLAVHLVLLLVHDFVPFDLLDLLVPVRSSYRPFGVALGIVSMYLLVLVAVTSWVRARMSTSAWRAVHLLAVPAFILALVHGVFAGTDTERPWMFAMYASTGIATLFLLLVRGLTAGYRPPRPTTAPRRGTPDVKREPASAA